MKKPSGFSLTRMTSQVDLLTLKDTPANLQKLLTALLGRLGFQMPGALVRSPVPIIAESDPTLEYYRTLYAKMRSKR